MLADLIKAIAAGLSLWEHKDKTKYQEKLFDLRRQYREEMAKPVGTDPGCRRNNVLDNIEFELRLLLDSWTSLVGEPKP